MVGVGTQVLVIVLAVFALALMDMFYPYNRGAMLSACVVLYALTAGIAGARCVRAVCGLCACYVLFKLCAPAQVAAGFQMSCWT